MLRHVGRGPERWRRLRPRTGTTPWMGKAAHGSARFSPDLFSRPVNPPPSEFEPPLQDPSEDLHSSFAKAFIVYPVCQLANSRRTDPIWPRRLLLILRFGQFPAIPLPQTLRVSRDVHPSIFISPKISIFLIQANSRERLRC